MINIKNKADCCGCSACKQKCPKQCITLKEDKEGFIYPYVDQDICVDCGLCEKVCPNLNRQKECEMPNTILAVKNNDDVIRSQSSSGGVFTAIAEKIIKDGGVLFGAKFDDKWNLIHSYTEKIEGIADFRGSKYIQSNIGNSYQQVEKFLKDNRKVLFTGTPCQVSGLLWYLGKPYENLITLDFVCHGVPSPGIFRWFLQEELYKFAPKEKYNIYQTNLSLISNGSLVVPDGITIESICFRDKRKGWKKYTLAIDLSKTNDKGDKVFFTHARDVEQSPFLMGFVRDLYLRPSCYQCPSKSLSSGSDFTIGDFWGQEYTFPEFDNDKGVSAVILNTDKARTLFERISDVSTVTRPFKEFYQYNPSIRNSVNFKGTSSIFWRKVKGTQLFERLISDMVLYCKLYSIYSRIKKINIK